MSDQSAVRSQCADADSPHQSQLAVLSFSTGADILPIPLVHRPFNRMLDPFGEKQFEKIRLVALFGLLHDRFVTPVGITAEHWRFLMWRKTIE
jgi:hypothetical protein